MHNRQQVTFAGQLHDRGGAFTKSGLIFKSRAADLYHDLHCNPSVSAQPYIRFIFCIACPAAPLSKLSRHETRIRRRPSAASEKPKSQKLVFAENRISGKLEEGQTRINFLPSKK